MKVTLSATDRHHENAIAQDLDALLLAQRRHFVEGSGVHHREGNLKGMGEDGGG